jgi:hypothetical protein
MVHITQISALCAPYAPCAPWAPYPYTCENTPECTLCNDVHFVHPVQPVHPMFFGAINSGWCVSRCTFHVQVHFCASGAPSAPSAIYSHTFLKMHQSAHSADLCALCTLCTQCTLCTSEPLFLFGASKCTRFEIVFCCHRWNFVYLVHHVLPVHLIAIYILKCTIVHKRLICALCAPRAPCAPFVLQRHYF